MIGSSFEEFFLAAERPVRYPLCARYGFETGREATAEAFAYAWEHWERLAEMNNPTGYVYRVGQRLGLRMNRRRDARLSFPGVTYEPSAFEPELMPALSRLTFRQRQAVVLIHGLGMTQVHTAAILGLSPSTVQRHAERGLNRLRIDLGVEDHV